MAPNPVVSADDIMAALIEQAVLDVVEDAGNEVSPEQLGARAQMRYAELAAPFVDGIGNYFAETIDATLQEVAAKSAFTAGAEPFSIEAVVDASMEKLESTVGAPADRRMAREAIRGYLSAAHGLDECDG